MQHVVRKGISLKFEMYDLFHIISRDTAKHLKMSDEKVICAYLDC